MTKYRDITLQLITSFYERNSLSKDELPEKMKLLCTFWQDPQMSVNEQNKHEYLRFVNHHLDIVWGCRKTQLPLNFLQKNINSPNRSEFLQKFAIFL